MVRHSVFVLHYLFMVQCYFTEALFVDVVVWYLPGRPTCARAVAISHGGGGGGGGHPGQRGMFMWPVGFLCSEGGGPVTSMPPHPTPSLPSIHIHFLRLSQVGGPLG